MDVIIIGAGPAGVSASLYIKRAGFDVTVFSKGIGALDKAHKIENYYGFPEGISGADLYANGIEGARRIGVEFREEEAVGLSFEEKLTLTTTAGKYAADAVILATGSSRLAPDIEGLKQYEGKGVSYCAVCDGFFYRGKKIAVLGSAEYAEAEMSELRNVVGEAVFLTNGNVPSAGMTAAGVPVITKPIARFEGETSLEKIVFDDGSEEALDGCFVAWGSAGSAALAKKIGAVLNGNTIVTDAGMATNVPGLFAAGDCCGGMLQVAKAVYEGALAGTSAVKYLRSLRPA